jgi:D-serine deaminase-like pyridoxal phosphate-dependent protein
MLVSEIDTPALLIDLDIMERNLSRVATYAKENGLRLRPHTKTHKSPHVGRLQLASGAVGLTVAKVGEAEVMLAAEPKDLLVAYPVIGRQKLARLMPVARATKVTVALDSLFAARQISDAARAEGVDIGILAEFDAGFGRVGVTPGEPLLTLVQSIRRLPHITFEGLTFYPGHIKNTEEGGLEELKAVAAIVDSVLADFRRAGVEVGVVSGGSTPTLFHSHLVGGLNEIRPGTYVYNDLSTVRSGACTLEDCAATLLCTVVSTARPGQMIVDGGSKTFSSDRLPGTAEMIFGHVADAPGARFFRMNEEHGYVDVSRAEREFLVGDRVRIVPNHVCAAVNLHDQVYGIRGDSVETTWKVEGRGKLQ